MAGPTLLQVTQSAWHRSSLSVCCSSCCSPLAGGVGPGGLLMETGFLFWKTIQK